MLDIKFIRENPDLIKEAVRKKKLNFNVDELMTLEVRRSELQLAVENMRAEQNNFTEMIARATDAVERTAMIDQMRTFKEALAKKEEELKGIMEKWREYMLLVPNVPDVTVPDGESDDDNVEVRRVGEIPTFDFTPRDHVELLLKNDMADFERGVKVAGFRGYFLKNDGAMLDYAVWMYTLEQLTKKGFSPMIVPSMVRREAFMGTGYLPQSEDDLYKTQDGEYLAGTGEVAMMGYHMDEVLDIAELPKKYIAFSPCFRREIGAHGKDTKGLIRVHEFMKFEQVVLCEANHETSVAIHEEITKNAEDILTALGLPYHVVVNCGGDLGLGQVKKYDIEAWVPSEEKYRETHSASYFHDFQTRRLNTRYRDVDGKMRFAHSLNNTAIATPRILVSIVENYQNADGTIRVPDVLQKFMGKTVMG